MKNTFALLVLAAAQSHAAITFTLPGNPESAAWTGLNNVNYPAASGWNSFGTNTQPFQAALSPDSGSTLGGAFNKLSGGGYFASTSIYNFGVPGAFHITDSSPLAGLETVVFQVDLGSALGAVPVLNYNGGSQTLAPDFQATAPGDFISGFGGPPAPTTNHAWQWDLSALGATSYEIRFTTIEHGTIFRLDLAAGDSFAQVIPEPSSLLLCAVGAIAFTRRRRA
jgi:hypothetical protein